MMVRGYDGGSGWYTIGLSRVRKGGGKRKVREREERGRSKERGTERNGGRGRIGREGGKGNERGEGGGRRRAMRGKRGRDEVGGEKKEREKKEKGGERGRRTGRRGPCTHLLDAAQYPLRLSRGFFVPILSCRHR
jgi:hypothetical protein